MTNEEFYIKLNELNELEKLYKSIESSYRDLDNSIGANTESRLFGSVYRIFEKAVQYYCESTRIDAESMFYHIYDMNWADTPYEMDYKDLGIVKIKSNKSLLAAELLDRTLE